MEVFSQIERQITGWWILAFYPFLSCKMAFQTSSFRILERICPSSFINCQYWQHNLWIILMHSFFFFYCVKQVATLWRHLPENETYRRNNPADSFWEFTEHLSLREFTEHLQLPRSRFYDEKCYIQIKRVLAENEFGSTVWRCWKRWACSP